MTKKKEEVKKVDLGLILGWIFGILFFFGTFNNLIGLNFKIALTFLIMGAAIFPPLLNLYKKKFNFKISSGLKIIIVIIGFFLVFFFAFTSSLNNYSDNSQNSDYYNEYLEYKENLEKYSENNSVETTNKVIEKGEIISEKSYQFTDIFGDYFLIIGEIKNTGTKNLDGGNFASAWGGKTRINTDFYNGNNQLVDSASKVFWKNYLSPNESIPFVICETDDFDIKTYKISVDEESTTDTYYEYFKISNEDIITNSENEVRITGKITNTGNIEKSAHLMVVLYDSNKNIIAVKTDYLGFETIKSGETKSFSVSIPNEKSCSSFDATTGQNQKVKSYQIYVQENLGVLAE